MTTTKMTTEEIGTFGTDILGLSYTETYVYVAHAEATPEATGDQMIFTSGLSEEFDEDQPFDHRVSAFVHSLLGSDDLKERNLKQIVSEFVTENNPGAANRPDHVGSSDGDRDNDSEANEDDDERGPPESAAPLSDEEDDVDDDTDT